MLTAENFFFYIIFFFFILLLQFSVNTVPNIFIQELLFALQRQFVLAFGTRSDKKNMNLEQPLYVGNLLDQNDQNEVFQKAM